MEITKQNQHRAQRDNCQWLPGGAQEPTGGKAASSGLSLSKRDLVVAMLQTIFDLSQTTSSGVEKTGSKIRPITQPYFPLALVLPAARQGVQTCSGTTEATGTSTSSQTSTGASAQTSSSTSSQTVCSTTRSVWKDNLTLLQLRVDEGLIDNLKYLDDGLRQMKIIYRLKDSNSFRRFRICIKIFNVTARSNEVSLIQQPHEKGTAIKVLQQKNQDQARNAS